MNVSYEITQVRAQLDKLIARLAWLEQHRAKLEALPNASFCADMLDFDHLPHADVVSVVRTLGGKWKKTPSYLDSSKIDYQTKVGDVTVRCYQGQPPPSCKIVEVEELVPEQVIPAHTRKVLKTICKPSLEAEIAFAQDKQQTNGKETQ
jgi:hypothetical protein